MVGAFLLLGFLTPTGRRLGPEAGSSYLNRFLDHPLFSRYISSVEGLAVLSGLILLWNASGGLQGAWLGSPTGLALVTGGASAIVAVVLSIPISATLSKLYNLGIEIEYENGQTQGLAFDQYHARLSRLGNPCVALLAVTVVGMASAQYLIDPPF